MQLKADIEAIKLKISSAKAERTGLKITELTARIA